MNKKEVTQKYEDELAAVQEKIDVSMANLHDALLSIGQHSVKDMTAAVVKFEDEARHIQICLDALNR